MGPATFSKSTFDTLSYASSLPTYPRSLYSYIFGSIEIEDGALRNTGGWTRMRMQGGSWQ
ncbi:hypothetical protein EDC04DRAFT_2568871 [Pisolithus marmoratus]|nr:hypothetical protein EDC04DRAFT_2568871 [Pisolithus marmoratus]